MNIVKWNLDDKEYQAIQIYRIELIKNMTDLGDSQEKLRLLVLSHQIANSGIPSIYLNESPSYISEDISKNPVVIVFDINNKFANFHLPPFFKIDQIVFNFQDNPNDELIQHLQRSMTLLMYYHFVEDDPCYHTSYLLFPCTDSYSKPFILQYIPLHINNFLVFRTIVFNNVSILVNSENHIDNHSIILISPYEHPFFIEELTPTEIIAQDIDHTISTFSRSEVIVSLILKPSPSLYSLFDRPKLMPAEIGATTKNMAKFCETGNGNHFSLSNSELDDFFKEKIRQREAANPDKYKIASSQFKAQPPDIHTILSEQVLDHKIRKQISKALIPIPFFPSDYQKAKPCPNEYTTFYEKNYGLTSTTLPLMLNKFYKQTPKHFEKIDLPTVTVNKNGQPILFPAEKVIKAWIPEGFKPISGPKDFHYIVFADSVLNEFPTKQFFAHLAHAYSILGFGVAAPYEKISTFSFMNPEEIMVRVSMFISENAQLEFSKSPTVVFAISDRMFDPVIHPNFYIIFLTPNNIRLSTFENLQELAFIIYARIRIESISILDFGDQSPPQSFLINAFFQFRYQPPFLLSRSNSKLICIHVCWDPVSEMSAWTDDTGSILECETFKSLESIIHEFLDIQTKLTDIKFRLFVGILAQNISPEMIEPSNSISNIVIYSIYPTPYIQLGSSYEGINDVFIQTKLEEITRLPDTSLQPLSSGYVSSRFFPTYFLALYKDISITDDHEESLKGIAIILSRLSWLSVKPHSENRTIGYPPILNILLQKIPAPADIVNQFEFLPYNDFY